eukprot:CAMPEP_0201281800 /NCGR_PEP_ID=MMETSP1317-20130820/4064_1 /ASSEMBLY_ACC=CAM_ASM_000770 /TAXON_ID=187299 /ORGANISM="Undescribed Undescribed, Strain Undescribed" /LENGTH=35 /DNA_ID= /DNA_START= /DNA_END= /DNA_ORIENTATION=
MDVQGGSSGGGSSVKKEDIVSKLIEDLLGKLPADF